MKLPCADGFGADLGCGLFNVDAVAVVAPVISFDPPGHGQSDSRLPGTRLTDPAGFVARFLDVIGVPRVHEVGHSVGGAITARLALDQSAREASVTLVNSEGLASAMNAGHIDGFVSAESRRDLKPVVEQLFADASLVDRQLLDDLPNYKRFDGVSELLRALSTSLFGGECQSEQPARELAGCGVLGVVVWGEADQVIPASHAGHASAGARVWVMPGAGHMTMMEQANDFNALLKGHQAEC